MRFELKSRGLSCEYMFQVWGLRVGVLDVYGLKVSSLELKSVE